MTINSGALADLAITKSVDNIEPHVGDTINYQVRVFNAGPNEAQNVVVTDIWPSGLIFIDSSSPVVFSGNTFTWNIGSLAHEGLAILKIVANVNATRLLTNFVNVTSTTPDPHLDDNNAIVTIQGQPTADIAVTKSVSPNHANYGENVVHTITVKNNVQMMQLE